MEAYVALWGGVDARMRVMMLAAGALVGRSAAWRGERLAQEWKGEMEMVAVVMERMFSDLEQMSG